MIFVCGFFALPAAPAQARALKNSKWHGTCCISRMSAVFARKRKSKDLDEKHDQQHLENMTKNDCEKHQKKHHFCPKLTQNASQNQSRRAPEASCEQLGAWSLQKWPESYPRSASGAIFHRKINPPRPDCAKTRPPGRPRA